MRLAPVLASLAFLLSAACGGSGGSPKQTASPTPTATVDDDPSCPIAVPGTSVTVEDTSTGAALVFVTTGDTAELRKRVAAMAAMHNEHHGKMGPLPRGDEAGGGHDHSGHGGHAGHDVAAGGGGGHAGHAGGMIGVHSASTAEEIDGGARLVIVVAPADVAKLRDELRMHAKHLAGGTCKMSHRDDSSSVRPPAEPPPAEPTPEKLKADLLANENGAYQAAKPVFQQYCASCHEKGGKSASSKKLDHFDMTAYPFGGHHAMEISKEIRHALGIDGSKPTMPKSKPGAVKGDELALIAAWADAFDASHEGGAHQGPDGHGGHHH